MTDQEIQNRLKHLFRESAVAHHDAFSTINGDDPEWPLWYAEHLQKPLETMLNAEFTRSHLIYCLMNADFEHTARAADTDWADFFAAEFSEHYAPSETPATDKLALYTMAGCPFCWQVIAVIKRLGLQVEMRDVMAQQAQRQELIEARGRATVPVLRIQSPDGEDRWMPESRDIIHYLEHTYG